MTIKLILRGFIYHLLCGRGFPPLAISLSLSSSTVSYIISFPLDSLPFHFLHRNVNIPSDFEFQMARPPETRISICLPVDPVQTRARSHKNFFFNLYTFFSLRVVLLVSKSYSGDQGRAI